MIKIFNKIAVFALASFVFIGSFFSVIASAYSYEDAMKDYEKAFNDESELDKIKDGGSYTKGKKTYDVL